MSNKKDIIRVGDYVRVVKPNRFLRCGYPLTIHDVMPEVHRMVSETDLTDYICSALEVNHQQLDEYGKFNTFLRNIAYCKLRQKKFGGRNRSIHTVFDPSLQDVVGKVSIIKYHKTGMYVPGSCYTTIDSEYDCDPPFLSNEKTHKILSITYVSNGSLIVPFDYLNIEDIHVKKVTEKEYIEFNNKVCK